MKDLNTTPKASSSSAPAPNPKSSHWVHNQNRLNKFAKAGPFIYFQAWSRQVGLELYKARLRSGSATLVKDINPGSNNSDPGFITAVGKKVFFAADDGTNGQEPWVSDGTAVGTRMLSNCLGLQSGGMYAPIGMGGYCYFSTKLASGGFNLVKSDGTAAGTMVLKNFYKNWSTPTVVGNKIVFSVWSTPTGIEAWATDGTAAGTILLKDTKPGAGSGNCVLPQTLGNKAYYWATDNSGPALWETDGTSLNTIKIGLPAGYTDSSWIRPIVCNGKILFNGNSVNGPEPWVSDGTLAGTFELKDFRVGSAGGGFHEPGVSGTSCFFQSENGAGPGLFVSDGTKAGTRHLRSFPQGKLLGIEGLGNNVIFFAYDQTHGSELWLSDGTTAGTRILKDIYPGTNSSNPSFMTSGGGLAFFEASDGVCGGELWITDGTAAGTKLHSDIDGELFTYGSNPEHMVNANGITYFKAVGGPFLLRKTDGTAAGTSVVSVFVDPLLGIAKESMSKRPFVVGNKLFFQGRTLATGCEPWVTDGTVSGTRILIDAISGQRSPNNSQKVLYGGLC